jgi:hypothetical protein
MTRLQGIGFKFEDIGKVAKSVLDAFSSSKSNYVNPRPVGMVIIFILFLLRMPSCFKHSLNYSIIENKSE